jgi:pyruvate/2-oxoglutarate dehydrogenase complex dihydrolipoamide acyltransferase (E2) component
VTHEPATRPRVGRRAVLKALPAVALLAASVLPALGPAAPTSAQMMAPDMPPIQSASDLRTTLNLMMQEHTALAGSTTNAKLGGRDAEYRAASEMLDMNSQMMGRFVGSLYGPDTERTFLSSWRSHIQAYDMYADGAKLGDAGMKQNAQGVLDQFVREQDALWSGANPNIRPGLMAEQLTMHVETTKQVIDAQAAQDFEAAYTLTKRGLDHAHMMGDPLAMAVAQQFPDRFPGNPMAPAAELRSVVNQLLQEHTLLAGNASGAYLGGRLAEAQAAGRILAQNGIELSSVIGQAYGPEAQAQFAQVWAQHLAQMVGFYDAIQEGDQAKQQQATDATNAFVQTTTAFFESATGTLPRDQFASALTAHGQALMAATQAQAQLDWSTAYMKNKEATSHARTVSDTLVQATVQKFPETFTS